MILQSIYIVIICYTSIHGFSLRGISPHRRYQFSLFDLQKSFEITKSFLSDSILSTRICLLDPSLKSELQSSNFWTAGTFLIQKCECIDINGERISFHLTCKKNGRICFRDVIIPFPFPIIDEDTLKTTLIVMANSFDCIEDTKTIIKLPFGRSFELPLDFKFNEVPHAQWFRAYIYDSVKTAVLKAIYDVNFSQKSRMQVKLNFPEGKQKKVVLFITILNRFIWFEI
jgi:hypothetical protein